jgi:hypothetical protein
METYYEKNKEKAKQYYLQNRERILERQRQYNLENHDKIKDIIISIFKKTNIKSMND